VPSPVAELLAAAGRAFERSGVRWFLFGAQAAVVHGASRLTADVDVTVEPGERPTSSLVDSLRGEGFALRVADADDFVEKTRVLPLVHEPTRMLCDVVLAGPGIEELFFDRARQRDVGGVRVPVVSADDLVAMKVLAGRSKDLDDVQTIVRAQGSALDLERARATLGTLEQALDRRDLLPVLEAILERTRREP